MRQLRHPHIVQLVAYYKLDQIFWILMIPSADLNLRDFLDKHLKGKRPDTGTVVQWFGCLTSALHYLHRAPALCDSWQSTC